MRLSKSLLVAAALVVPCVRALPQTRSQAKSVKFRSVPRATDIGERPKYNVLAATGETDIDLTSSQDLIYIAEVTVGGEDYLVQLDTGSSDLWISGTGIKNAQQTTLDLHLTYGTGYAEGVVVRAPVEFAGFTLPSQALLDAIMAQNPVLNLGAAGVLGLGFTSLSSVDHAANATGADWGRSLLYNIFAQDPSVPNFITFLLTRSNDTEAPVEGSFTISETEPDYAAVTEQPKVPTWPINGPTRWNILLDAFAVHGKRYTVGTTVTGVTGSRAVILLDSGTTFTYAPITVVNAMYKDVKGAKFDETLGQWVLPCDTRIEITLYIGDKEYHLHPLDMVVHSTVNRAVCVGSFIPAASAIARGEFDWLVGVNVLRSFYTLYDFGDPVHNAPEGVSPTVQMLQLRTAAQANMDFYNVRGGERPTEEDPSTNTPTDGGSTVTDDQSTDGTGAPPATSSPSTDGGLGQISASVKSSIQKVVDYMPAILGILGVNVAILIALFIAAVIWVVRRRRNNGKRRPAPLSFGSDYKSVATGEQGRPSMMTPTTPAHGADASQYDPSSLSARRGLRPPQPLAADGVRHSTASGY